MSGHDMRKNENESNHHIRNAMLRYVSSASSATPISPSENNQRQRVYVPTNVLRMRNTVASFSNPPSPTLTSHAQGFSTSLPNHILQLNSNPSQYQMGNTPPTTTTAPAASSISLPIKRRYSDDSSSSTQYELGQTSTRPRLGLHPFQNNPNNNFTISPTTPFPHFNSFQTYQQGAASTVTSQIGMASSPSTHHQLLFGSGSGSGSGSGTNQIPNTSIPPSSLNNHQHVMIPAPTIPSVPPSFPPNVMRDSSFNPLLSYVQQNQLHMMFGGRTSEQNQLFFATARVGQTSQYILMSNASQLRPQRNQLRNQIYRVQQQQLNTGLVSPDDLIITRYSTALNILDAQERLDQLNSGTWRYVLETGLREQEIMAFIRQEFFHSNAEQQHETCTICQENYLTGDHIGGLDCGHKYHLGCIKQWLSRKNMCPVCKQRALNVFEDYQGHE